MSAGSPRSRIPGGLALAVLGVLVAGLIAVGVAVQRVAGPSSAPGVPTPLAADSVTSTSASTSGSGSTTSTTSTTASSSASSAVSSRGSVAFADCSAATFGDPLVSVSPPADVHAYLAAPATTIDVTKLYRMTITTARGAIVLCLQPQLAPKTVNVLVTLARNKFYDGLTFHRVEPNFVIQGGDPKGDGTGGPGFSFPDEPVLNTYEEGAVAMANSGPNTNGSQFFICMGTGCSSLPHNYNLFGHVMTGQDVVNATQKGDVMTSVTVAQQR